MAAPLDPSLPHPVDGTPAVADLTPPAVVRAPRGRERRCRGWAQEAALRLLMNSLDPEVAERPEQLVVYGGAGRAARNWACYQELAAALEKLGNDETLLVQSGKAAGVFATHAEAPRVLIANGNLVGRWSSWERFEELERRGLTMFGQISAGSWVYTGSQGVLQGTYTILAAAARQHFGGTLAGKLVVSGGMGGMGGAQPLAATLNGAAYLGIEVDAERIKRRVRSGYCDILVNDLDEALRILKNALRRGQATSVGLVGNCAEVMPELLRRGVAPDLLTDQTSAHDLLHGYIPAGLGLAAAAELRRRAPEEYRARALSSIARQAEAMLELRAAGAVTFEFGNNLRRAAHAQGVQRALEIPGFYAQYVRPLLLQGLTPLRWVALSGAAEDIRQSDALAERLFADNRDLLGWLRLARRQVRFQGLPARVAWLDGRERARFGLELNEMVRSGRLQAPVVIASDELNGGAAAAPQVESEGLPDGSGAVADWPLLNALLHTASGASWVAIQNGGGPGIGDSLHAGQATVADGTAAMGQRLERVLTGEAGIGMVRHLDAGYAAAREVAGLHRIGMPVRAPQP